MDLLVHKNAHRSYHILERFEAGISLSGTEVKSLRQKHGSLREAYIKVNSDGALLVQAHIPAYQGKQPYLENYQSLIPRKLLLKKQELKQIREALHQQGQTIIPLRIYLAKNLIKVELAIARGKKLFDKRNDLKNRTAQREIHRAIKEIR